MAPETFESHPAFRTACREGIDSHAGTFVPVIEEAEELYAPHSDWSAESLATHTQAVSQGAFIVAKAQRELKRRCSVQRAFALVCASFAAIQHIRKHAGSGEHAGARS